MPLELSKSQKKIARELINKSLQVECARFLEEIKLSVSERVQEVKSPHEAYIDLYKRVKTFDKHIARRYDDLRGSWYFMTLVGLFFDGILNQEDLDLFNEEVKAKLLDAVNLRKKDLE